MNRFVFKKRRFRVSMKGILILICTMLFLSALASVQLLFNYFDTIREYRENLYRITLDSYVSLIDRNCGNLSMAMEVTALDQGVRANIFKSGVDQREMLGLGNDMRKIVESNTYLLCPGAEIYSHKFFTYLPGDGRNFFPLEAMEKESWIEDYRASGQSYYQCFLYSAIASAWQLVLVHTINDFSTAYPAVYGEQRVCYEAVAVNVGSLIPKQEEIFSGASARVFLVDTQTGQLVYRSDAKLEEAALGFWATTGEEGPAYGFVNDMNGNRYAASSCKIGGLGAALVLLFDPVPVMAGDVQNEIGNVIFSVGLFVILTLVLFLFYLNYRRRIWKTIGTMDHFDESSPLAEEPEGKGDEIDELDRHVVSMQNRIRTLIEEEYTVKLQMISAQHEALIACINPHFLYNTLSSVSAMASLEKAEDTNEMIYALSDMFKYSSDVSRKTVTLGEELHNIASYLHIQQVRCGDSFVWHSDVPPELMSCGVPKLMLQPVVENCFKHGFEAREKRGVKNEIDICAVRHGEFLKIYVNDNGRGMNGERLEELRQSLNGAAKGGEATATEIGLRNVHKRLQLIYGAGSGIEISCEKNGYTCVKITLKYQEGDGVQPGKPL